MRAVVEDVPEGLPSSWRESIGSLDGPIRKTGLGMGMGTYEFVVGWGGGFWRWVEEVGPEGQDRLLVRPGAACCVDGCRGECDEREEQAGGDPAGRGARLAAPAPEDHIVVGYR